MQMFTSSDADPRLRSALEATSSFGNRAEVSKKA